MTGAVPPVGIVTADVPPVAFSPPVVPTTVEDVVCHVLPPVVWVDVAIDELPPVAAYMQTHWPFMHSRLAQIAGISGTVSQMDGVTVVTRALLPPVEELITGALPPVLSVAE